MTREPKLTGFIGKAAVDEHEQALLVKLGRSIAKAGNILVAVPAPGAYAAVRVGVKAEGGEVREIERGTLTESAHAFVYADERLMSRLRLADPSIDHNPKVFLMSSPLEIEMWLDAARDVLKERNITCDF